MPKMIAGLDRDEQEQEVEITPEMIEAGRKAFEAWMLEWNYLEDGFPGDATVDDLIASILASTRADSPVVERSETNLRDIASSLFAASCKSATV